MQPTTAEHIEFTCTISKSKQVALQKLLTNYHYQDIISNPDYYAEVHPGFAEYLRGLNGKETEKGGQGKNWLMVTVNPKEEVSLLTFRSRVDKFVGRTFAEMATWAYEQRGEEVENIHGMHAHIFIKRDTKVAPSRIKQFAQTDFGDLVGHEKHIDIRYFKDQDSINGVNYVKGHKADPDKASKHNMDVLWRQMNDIEAYYEKH